MSLIIGIDTGTSGAIGVIDMDGKFVAVHDIPTRIAKINGKNYKRIDIPAFRNMMQVYKGDLCKLGIEKTWPRPENGIRQAFTFGEGYGILQGVCYAMDIIPNLVSPQKWKGAMLHSLRGFRKTKEDSLTMARKQWPEAELHLKKHDGRAEALLIAGFLHTGFEQRGHKDGIALLKMAGKM